MSKKKFLGSHQKAWVWGRHAVMEILEGGVWPVLELLITEEAEDRERAVELAGKLDYTVQTASSERIEELCRARDHQGFAARMGEFPYAPLQELLQEVGAREAPLVVILDGVQDPFNLGAIIRSAEVLGVSGIILGPVNQAGINSLAARTSAGAVNRMRIARAEDMPSLVTGIRDSGLCLTAASEKGAVPASEHDFAQATALVVGNEATGINADLLEACETHICIPQQGEINSLNVAAAAAVLFYEADRQKRP